MKRESTTDSPEPVQDASKEHLILQRKRAAAAVAIMCVFSAVLIGAVELMYYVVDHGGPNFASETSDTAGEQAEGSIEVGGDPFYVLLIGSDSRRGTAVYTGKSDSHGQVDQHADVITLMRVDPESYLVTLVSIPGDTWVDSLDAKISDALLDNDPEEVLSAAESLTGVEIDYYMQIEFIGFEDLIDSLGGIYSTVYEDSSMTDPVTASKVTVTSDDAAQGLSGEESLVLVRNRDQYESNEDAYRQQYVRELEVAIIEKALTDYDPSAADQIVGLLEENLKTNLDYDDLSDLMADFIENSDSVNFHTGTGPYELEENDDGDWVVAEDGDLWAELMAVVEDGGDPTEVVAELSLSNL